jgi:hypothetical protein
VQYSGPGCVEGRSAVWIRGESGARKIGAIDIRLSPYVTMHGFASPLLLGPLLMMSPQLVWVRRRCKMPEHPRKCPADVYCHHVLRASVSQDVRPD